MEAQYLWCMGEEGLKCADCSRARAGDSKTIQTSCPHHDAYSTENGPVGPPFLWRMGENQGTAADWGTILRERGMGLPQSSQQPKGGFGEWDNRFISGPARGVGGQARIAQRKVRMSELVLYQDYLTRAVFPFPHPPPNAGFALSLIWGSLACTGGGPRQLRNRRSYKLHSSGSGRGLETSRSGTGGGPEPADIEGTRSWSHGQAAEPPELGLGETESTHCWTVTTCRAAPLACSDWSEEGGLGR
jgi:hypothetical protein